MSILTVSKFECCFIKILALEIIFYDLYSVKVINICISHEIYSEDKKIVSVQTTLGARLRTRVAVKAAGYQNRLITFT